MSQKIELRTAAWAGDGKETLTFPDQWRLHLQNMRGHERRALGREEIAACLKNPLGAPALAELARGRESACIIVDDLTRPTPAHAVLEVLLPLLRGCGLGPEKVSLVSALAAHHPMSRADWAAKAGPEVVAEYPVYNHNLYENLVFVGKTSLGTELFLNREVMDCDLKIGIGCLLPYWWANTYSGGGKLILPGVAGLESIKQHHGLIKKSRAEGEPAMPRVWANMHEAAELAGLDCLVNLVVNQRREAVGVFAGKAGLVHRQGSRLAAEVYATAIAPRCQVVVVNAYPQDLQIGKCFWGVHNSLLPGGTAVILARHPEGLTHQHFLTSRFGRGYGGANHNPAFRLRLGEAKRICFYVRRKVRLDALDMAGAEGVEVSFHTEWGEIEELLARSHGPGARAAIYPYAALQEPTL